jgi:hypothetical protein
MLLRILAKRYFWLHLGRIADAMLDHHVLRRVTAMDQLDFRPRVPKDEGDKHDGEPWTSQARDKRNQSQIAAAHACNNTCLGPSKTSSK